MSTPATTPLEQTLTRQDSPLTTEPWEGESAPHPDLDSSPPAGAEPREPEPAAPGMSGRIASQAMSQGQRSLNGELHQQQMLNHLDAQSADGMAGEDVADPTAVPTNSGNANPNPDDIRLRAYQIYLRRNGEEGHALDHWLEAERQVLQNHELPPEVD